MKRPIIILVVLAFLWLNPSLKAQNSIGGYLDIGETQVSEGLYSHISNIGCFEKTKWGMKAGYQLGLVQPQDIIFNSWYMNPYGKIKIENVLLDMGGEYLWTAISQDIRETNWVVSARTTLNHWQLGFGTSFRTYRLSRKAADVYSGNRITENWNMMYNATYALKPYENRWNLSGTFTNYDRFIIQQENNPMLNLRFDYNISSRLLLYSELWYKPAGLMVIRVTYYGMFLRLGVSWKI
ncbi:MAG: hypothetical protein WCS03_16790 [Bacteroidota bacterium]